MTDKELKIINDLHTEIGKFETELMALSNTISNHPNYNCNIKVIGRGDDVNLTTVLPQAAVYNYVVIIRDALQVKLDELNAEMNTYILSKKV